MALSPQDRAYYEEKLNWKGALYLFGVTIAIGAVVWPLLLYLQDWQTPRESLWTQKIVLETSMNGAALGLLVSGIMYTVFRVMLSQGWMPKRR